MLLSFWLNAFIPGAVPGYTQAITAGTHAGRTAIPMPRVARILNPTKPFDTGYLTDQRSFDTSISASTRMRSLVILDIGTTARVVRTAHETSGTTQVTIPTGTQTGFAYADMSRCSWSALTPVVRRFSAGSVHIPLGGSVPLVVGAAPSVLPTFEMTLIGQAGDPLINGAADIDYGGRLTVTILGTGGAAPAIEVQFEGLLDDFPAFEAYANFGGATKTFFTATPPPGNTVTNLVGPATRPIGGVVRFP